jgi:hypothetical protein
LPRRGRLKIPKSQEVNLMTNPAVTASAVIFVGLMVLAGALVLTGYKGAVTGPETPSPQPSPITCDSTTSPTVTINTPDLYGGTAVTSTTTIRKVGSTTTSNIDNSKTFSANPGDQYLLITGVANQTAGPYGPTSTYTVPCEETPSIELSVVDDALASDLTAIAFDPDDGNQISGTDPVDIDTGQVKTVQFRWTGSFEEDFGNRWCEDSEGVKNALIVRYNNSAFDNVYVTSTSGSRLPVASIPALSRNLTSVAQFTDMPFEFPVIRSNADYVYNLVLDVSDTLDASGNGANVTLFLMDVSRYEDTDVTPSAFKCGVIDEDGSEVGAANKDVLYINLTSD